MDQKTEIEVIVGIIVFLIVGLSLLVYLKPSAGPVLSPTSTSLPAVNPTSNQMPGTVTTSQVQVNPATGQITVTAPTYPTPIAQTPSEAVFAFGSIDISVANHTFSPKFFKVRAGSKLTINFTALDMTHTLVFDDSSLSDVAVGANAGQTKSITFTVPSAPGTYTFYCNVGHHRDFGESGAMIVE